MSIKGTNKFFETMVSQGKVRAAPILLDFLQDMDISYRKKSDEVFLDEDYELLSPDLLSGYLSHSGFSLPKIEVYRIATSTNDIVMDEFRRGSKKDCLCLAEAQTKGKGRRGRSGSVHLEETSI